MSSYTIQSHEKPPAYFGDVHLRRAYVEQQEIDLLRMQLELKRLSLELAVLSGQKQRHESRRIAVKNQTAIVEFDRQFRCPPCLSIVPIGEQPCGFAVSQLNATGFVVSFDQDIEEFEYVAIEK